MKTWLKALLALCALGVLALISGVVALKMMYPPERIKDIAVHKLVEALGREIKLADASIGLGGVSLGGLEVSEVPNFAAGTAATLKSLSVKVELKPLFMDKEVRISVLSIDGLNIKVIAEKDGSMNVTRAPQKKATAPLKPGGDSSKTAAPVKTAPAFSLQKLHVSDGRIEYEDRRTQTKASISGLRLAATGVSLKGAFPLELGTRFAWAGKTGRVDFKGKIDPQNANLDAAGAVIEALTLHYDGKNYSLSGELKPASAPAGTLAIALPAMEAGGIKIPALKGTLHAAYKNELIALTQLKLSGEGASLNGGILQTKTGWNLKSLEAGLDGLALRLDGSYTDTAIDLRVRSKELDLERAQRWASGLKEMNAVGTVEIDVSAKGKPDAPSLSGSLTLSQASLVAQGQALSELNGTVAFTPVKVDSTLRGKLNGSPFDVTLAAADYKGLHPKVTLAGNLATLDLSKLPASEPAPAPKPVEPAPAEEPKEKAPGKTADAKGTITIGSIVHPRFKAAKTTLRWDLLNLGKNLSMLDGTVAFNIGSGTFDDLKVLGESNSMVKIVLLPIMIIQKAAKLVKVPLFPDFDRVDFQEIVGDYAVAKGLMTVNKSHLDSSVAFVTMTGKADLGKDRLDLRVNAKLRGGALKAPVAFKVTGSMADPKVKVDTAAILKQPEVNKAINQGRELLKKQGEQLLKGLFGR